jgi:hypothetical protein
LDRSIVRVPMRKSMYLFGFVVCISFGLWFLYLSFFGGFSGEHFVELEGHSKGSLLLSVFVSILPGNIALFFLALFMLLLTYFLFRKLTGGDDAVIISSEGIIINVTIVKTGLIRWEEIMSFDIVEVGRQKNLSINLVNPEPFIKRQKGSVRIFLFINRLMGYDCPIMFTASSVKMKLDRLQELMQEYQSNIGR